MSSTIAALAKQLISGDLSVFQPLCDKLGDLERYGDRKALTKAITKLGRTCEPGNRRLETESAKELEDAIADLESTIDGTITPGSLMTLPDGVTVGYDPNYIHPGDDEPSPLISTMERFRDYRSKGNSEKPEAYLRRSFHKFVNTVADIFWLDIHPVHEVIGWIEDALPKDYRTETTKNIFES